MFNGIVLMIVFVYKGAHDTFHIIFAKAINVTVFTFSKTMIRFTLLT